MADQVYKCEICGEECKTSQALASHVRNKHRENGAGKVVAKGQALDLAVSNLRVPMVPEKFNGNAAAYWSGFNEGVSYGANTVLVGIRAAQELSNLGISQATPIIKMAQEMRQAEGQAAQILAGEFAEAAVNSNKEILAAIRSLGTANSSNPMMSGLWQMIQPHLWRVIGSVMGMGGGVPGVQPQVPGQPQSEESPPPATQSRLMPSFQQMDDDERKEVFGE